MIEYELLSRNLDNNDFMHKNGRGANKCLKTIKVMFFIKKLSTWSVRVIFFNFFETSCLVSNFCGLIGIFNMSQIK